jgi:putative MATE family efflux protein
MLATGGSAVVARKMGEGEEKRAKQDFTLIILAGAGIGICITILGITFLDEIIWGLGASEILYPYCREYLLVLLLFTPACMIQVLFQNLIVTAGKPGFGMWLSLSAGAINILLDYIFIVPLHMGIGGSALGTGIGYLIPSVIGIVFFSRKKGTLHFCRPMIDFKVLGESCFNGSSEMVSQIATAITIFLFNVTMMKFLGESGVAAITIIIYTQFLLTTLYIGFSMGVAPVISYNYGGGYNQRLKRILRICLSFIGVVSICIFGFSMFFGASLVSVFSPKGTKVYDIAREGFWIFPVSFLFCGFNIFASATFTALSNGKISAIISFMRTFGFILIGLLVFPVFFNVIGIWLAVPVAEFLTFIWAVGFIERYAKKHHSLKNGV